MKSGFFLISVAISYLIGHYFGNGPISIMASVLISYHAYLAFLVITAEHETGFSMPIVQTIVTHLACLTIVVGIGLGRHYIPFFGIIRLFIPALAPFETNWLFSGAKKKKDIDPFAVSPATDASLPLAAAPVAPIPAASEPVKTAPVAKAKAPVPVAAAASAPSLYMNSTGDDFEEFRQHLCQPKRPFRRPGITVKEEYELWLAHRAKTRTAASSTAQTA
jgi:hypothetical protein